MASAYIGPYRSGECGGVIEARCTTSRLPKPPRHRALSQTSSPSASPLNHQPGQRQKCKFLLCCRCCQAPFAHFFLCSLLFLRTVPQREYLAFPDFYSAHLSIYIIL